MTVISARVVVITGQNRLVAETTTVTTHRRTGCGAQIGTRTIGNRSAFTIGTRWISRIRTRAGRLITQVKGAIIGVKAIFCQDVTSSIDALASRAQGLGVTIGIRRTLSCTGCCWIESAAITLNTVTKVSLT